LFDDIFYIDIKEKRAENRTLRRTFIGQERTGRRAIFNKSDFPIDNGIEDKFSYAGWEAKIKKVVQENIRDDVVECALDVQKKTECFLSLDKRESDVTGKND